MQADPLLYFYLYKWKKCLWTIDSLNPVHTCSTLSMLWAHGPAVWQLGSLNHSKPNLLFGIRLSTKPIGPLGEQRSCFWWRIWESSFRLLCLQTALKHACYVLLETSSPGVFLLLVPLSSAGILLQMCSILYLNYLNDKTTGAGPVLPGVGENKSHPSCRDGVGGWWPDGVRQVHGPSGASPWPCLVEYRSPDNDSPTFLEVHWKCSWLDPRALGGVSRGREPTHASLFHCPPPPNSGFIWPPTHRMHRKWEGT